MLNVS